MAWKQMDLHTTHNIPLSLEGLDNYIKNLRDYKQSIPQKVANAVDKASQEGLKNNLKSAKLIPTKVSGTKVIGGIQTTDPIDTFREFGTGVVGSNNPHISEYLNEVGWVYDVNKHGEKGWIYPTGNGFRWTRGIPASMKFWNGMKNIERAFPDYLRQEFRS